MTTDRASSASGRARWTVFYDSPSITITDVSVTTKAGRYRTDELRDIMLRTTNSYLATMTAAAAGAVELVLGAALGLVFGSLALVGAAIVAATGMTLAVLADGRRNPRWLELVAVHRGRPIVLFATAGNREFQQVRRALIRAVEATRTARP